MFVAAPAQAHTAPTSLHELRPARPPADEGFGVGHTRVTQTKGVWMWGEPTQVTAGGRSINVSLGGSRAALLLPGAAL